jgi:hypothetical protein
MSLASRRRPPSQFLILASPTDRERDMTAHIAAGRAPSRPAAAPPA